MKPSVARGLYRATMKAANSKKPLSAFEVYALKKEPDAPVKTTISKNKEKKLKRKKKIELKKLKEAGLLVPEELEKKPRTDVMVKHGAVKPIKVQKVKTPVKKKSNKTIINGVSVDKKKNNNIDKNGSGDNVKNITEHGNELVTESENRNGRKKKFKAFKERGNPDKEFRSRKENDRQADFKKKIAQVKKLLDKKSSQANEDAPGKDDDNGDWEDCGEGMDEVSDPELVECVEDGIEWDDDEEEEEDVIESDGLDADDASDGEMQFDIQTFDGEEINAVNCEDSRVQGLETFQWIIKPHTEKEFYSKHWEKAPLLIKRKQLNYYKGLFSTQDFDKILHEQVVLYSKNLDVTSYSDGKRETHNPIGQAHAPVVWDYYNNGCSLRLLNPQTFQSKVWKCLSSLQEYFNSFCGANIYLTPPDTQGFAPHWDDIEAFILQLEGKKRWKVYKPRNKDETLPEHSSPNLSEDSIGKPILETILEAGDLLYFPRGYIHQGHAVENEHSLHITISTYQKNSWGHYLEKLLPQALTVAMAEDVEFRKGLPRDYLNYMGIVHMEKETEERTVFKKKVCDLVMRMMDHAPMDALVDQRGASFIHDSLPPYLTPADKECSVYGGGEKWCPKKKQVINRVELQPDTPIRLIRGNCVRLVVETENVNIYHTMENSREYHKEEPQYLEVASESAPVVETLIHAYPAYLPIETLPLQDETEKMAVVSGLWERGLLVTAHPLEPTFDD